MSFRWFCCCLRVCYICFICELSEEIIIKILDSEIIWIESVHITCYFPKHMQNRDLADSVMELEFNNEVCDSANFKTVPIFVLGVLGSHHYKTDLSCFLWIRCLLCHLLPMRNRGFCTQWQICELQVSISIFAICLLIKGIEHSDDIWSWPFYVRLLQLLVLACALAELTWPKHRKLRDDIWSWPFYVRLL